MRHHLPFLLLFPLLLSFGSCAEDRSDAFATPEAQAAAAAPSADPFDTWLDAPHPPADGFDYPIGDADGTGSYRDKATGATHDGWYIATDFGEEYSLGIHPGEDWNGRGGGATDLGQPVYATANGRVLSARHEGKLWGNVIVIEHILYENHEKRTIHSLYAHLASIDVEPGDVVARRDVIGSVGQDPDKLFAPHLHFELRSDTTLAPTYWPTSQGKDHEWVRAHYIAPSRFIDAHRELFVPQEEAVLLLVDHESYRARFFANGRLVDEIDVAFGQSKGRKRIEGDNRTPKGIYFIVEKERGEIPGEFGAYFGGHWIEMNYPNKYDAEWGREEGVIDEATAETIARLWRQRKPTPQTTGLGSGIGLHGWKGRWRIDGSRHLSWGCVVLQNDDIATLYERLPVGGMVVIR